MTVSMQLTKRIYAGNGLTRVWEVDFPLTDAQDLQVYLTSPAGYETKINADYELNAAMDTLTYPTVASGKDPLATGWKITLVRQTPSTQEIDLLRQGELDAEVLEQGYDKLTLITQELAEKVDRCIKYPVSTQPENLETDTFLANILAAKQDAVTASSQAASAAQTAQQSAASATQTAQTASSDIAQAKQTALNDLTAQAQTIQADLSQSVSTGQAAAQSAQYYAEHTLGKQVGEIYYSQSALASDNRGALPLFTGETVASADTLYPEFYAWVSTHSELQISAADYETALSTYGECPKYVIDTENKTIRLPKLVHYIKMANTTDGISQHGAGLPNITGGMSPTGLAGVSNAYGAFYNEASNTTDYQSNTREGYGVRRGFNASRSSSIYGASHTVTPAHTTLYPWVCAYNAAVPASTAQAAQFQTALSGKADVNLDNLSDAGKVVAAKMAMPSNFYIDIAVGASNSYYTAIADGYFLVNVRIISAGGWVCLRRPSNGFMGFEVHNPYVDSVTSGFLPVKQGDEICLSYDGVGFNDFRFIYAEGAKPN